MKAYLSNWNFSRGIRLILGLIILVQGFLAKDYLFGFFGSYFVILAVLNVGCGSCKVISAPEDQTRVEEVKFEEIK